MTIHVKNIINSNIAAFHNEGLQVFSLLEKAYINHEPVIVSFAGIERCATQFLNASIGKMYLKYNPEEMAKLISYDLGGLKTLADKITEVKENAVHSKEYDALIENATAY